MFTGASEDLDLVSSVPLWFEVPSTIFQLLILSGALQNSCLHCQQHVRGSWHHKGKLNKKISESGGSGLLTPKLGAVLLLCFILN